MIRLLSISDIHIGHNLVPSANIIDRLYKYMIPKLDHTDILIIGGDITDTDLSFGDTSTKLLLYFFMDLYEITSKLDIPILLLRGTISHDRNHLKTVTALHEKGSYKNTLYYHETLAVEYVEKYDLRIGFIPDNLPYKSSSQVITTLKKIMEDKDYDYLDYVISHGYFSHLVPEHINLGDHVYKEKDFSFVRRYVLSGHVHTPSQHGRVLMNGSFDRLNHGEEESKGFLYLEDDEMGNIKINFIENEEATKFITLDMIKATEDDIIKKIKTTINEHEEILHLRLKHPDPILRISIRDFIRNNYKNVRYTHLSSVKNKKDKNKELLDETNIIFNLSEETLIENIWDFLKQDKNHSLTKKKIGELLELE